MTPLTDKQHTACERFWRSLPSIKAVQQEFFACGFEVMFSCISWREMRDTLPDMAEVLGHSMIWRHRLR